MTLTVYSRGGTMQTLSAMTYVTCSYERKVAAQYAMCADNTRQLLMLSLTRI